MARGRRANLDAPVDWKLSVPSSLAAKVELLLMDPVSNKPRYGLRSDIIVTLLKALLADYAGDTKAMEQALTQIKRQIGV